MVDLKTRPSKELAASPGISAEAVKALSERLQEPGWLRDLRRGAWLAFERLPMPTPTTEGWRRTDIRDLRLEQAQPTAPAPRPVDSPRALPPSVRRAVDRRRAAGFLVHQDGGVVYRQVAEDLERQGVIVVDLPRAIREHASVVRDYLSVVVSPTAEKFAALNAALWNGGSFVYVPRGVAIELPLHLINYVGAEGFATLPHTLVIAESESDVTIVDESISEKRSGQGLASEVVEVIAKPGARVRYVQLQDWGPEQWTFSTLRALAERDASVEWIVVGLGGRLTKANVETRMVGDGSETGLYGLIFGEGQQHFDYYTLQSHEGSRSRSDLLFKAVLRDRARSNYVGLVRIAEDAVQCDANQESRNLLLTRGAKADADPRLEILNSDVLRASHGATVGPVDQEMLFYLMTRGLSLHEAERMLIEAFFQPIVEKVPLDSSRQKVLAAIQRRLNKPR